MLITESSPSKRISTGRPGAEQILIEMGNSGTAIPYYAIFTPGLDEPDHFGGNIMVSPQSVIDRINSVIDSGTSMEQVASSNPSTDPEPAPNLN